MSYWDSSALIKLYVQELDSATFRELAVKASREATGSLTRHEVRTVFRRREAEGVLPSGEATALYDELTADIAVPRSWFNLDWLPRYLPYAQPFPPEEVNRSAASLGLFR
jgi:hypothetical protein